MLLATTLYWNELPSKKNFWFEKQNSHVSRVLDVLKLSFKWRKTENLTESLSHHQHHLFFLYHYFATCHRLPFRMSKILHWARCECYWSVKCCHGNWTRSSNLSMPQNGLCIERESERAVKNTLNDHLWIWEQNCCGRKKVTRMSKNYEKWTLQKINDFFLNIKMLRLKWIHLQKEYFLWYEWLNCMYYET